MKLVISDNTRDKADAYTTTKELNDIIDKLRSLGCKIKYKEV